MRRDEVAEHTAPYGFRLERSSNGATVWATGQLDLAASEDLRTALVAAGRHYGRVILDLSETEFIDGTCLGAIVAARKETGPEIDIVLRRPTPIVARLLRLTGLDERFEVVA